MFIVFFDSDSDDKFLSFLYPYEQEKFLKHLKEHPTATNKEKRDTLMYFETFAYGSLYQREGIKILLKLWVIRTIERLKQIFRGE